MVPYLAHLFAVASLVMEDGGTEVRRRPAAALIYLKSKSDPRVEVKSL